MFSRVAIKLHFRICPMASDDDPVKRLWEEILILRKAIKNAEASLLVLSFRLQCLQSTNRTTRPRRGNSRKPRSN